MPGWAVWVLLGVGVWLALMLVVLRILGLVREFDDAAAETAERRQLESEPPAPPSEPSVTPERRRILVVDDDAGLRLLLRTTLTADEFAVEEAVSAEEAAELGRFWAPAVVILDVGLPGKDGFTFCRELKQNPTYGRPLVVLLTGKETTAEETDRAGADAVLRKPFSPLELITLLDDVSHPTLDLGSGPTEADTGQLLIYARDLNRLLELERTQRRLLQQAYSQTATALADALEAKDPATGQHALRVQRYATELTRALDPTLLGDPSLEYGFLLHDVGKLAIPDRILQKEGPLDDAERRIMQRHTVLGAQILADVVLLQGEGLRVVRSHHERWDGAGYPDGLGQREIPVGARIFALIDAVDAMTTERPYRAALRWEDAVDEIVAQSGSQFDPQVVAAFAAREGRLRRISEELAGAAA